MAAVEDKEKPTDPTAVDGTAGQYDYTNYYQQQWAAQQQQGGADAANWQYWQSAGVQIGPNGATPAANYYYGYPNYNAGNGQAAAAAQNYAAYQYPYQQQQYDYTQAAQQQQQQQQQQYNYAAATQYAQQYLKSTQQQQQRQPPPPSHPPPQQPPPPSYPPPANSPTAKPAAPSWASVVSSNHTTETPAYTGVNFKIAKAAPLQRTGMPAQPLQHIIQQQQQTKQQQQKPQQNTAESSDKMKGQWPPPLKAYVERIFEKCSDEAERLEIEAELKKLITKAIQADTLWTHDWDNEPLITLKKPKKNKRKNDFTIAPEDEERKQRRQKRFLSTSQSRNNNSSASAPAEFSELNWDDMTVKGYCQDLEKQYLRLTSAPDPATVRPEPVLKKTIKMLREKWQQSEDYDYICEQLKSVRQDLTVQRIKNGFTVGVYEMHARLALENDDLGEFNQCQTQLKELYREGLSTLHVAEFTGYRILYFLHVHGDVASALSSIPPAMREEPAVAHAIQVMLALATNNYNKFFKLYGDTPNMGQYLMDKLVKPMRMTAIKCIVKSYRPTVGLEFVQKELGFAKTQDCRTFLKEIGVSVVSSKDGPEIDTKNSQAVLDAVV